MEKSGEELDSKNVDSISAEVEHAFILEEEDEALKTDNDNIKVMKEEIQISEKSLEERMKKILDEFLINENNLSPSKAAEVEIKVFNAVDNRVAYLVSAAEAEIETIAN